MGNEMLLMDGVVYEEWTPTSHDELAQMISEHSKEIFGQESIYLDIRQKLKGGSIAAIPDAYCLTFGPDTFWVIEVERSAPDPYSHIVNQLSRFINGLDSPQSQRELRDAVYNNMSPSDRERAQSRSGGAVHPWLEKLINQPSLIVITEKATDEIRRAVATLRITPRVYEFRTFCRQGVGLAVHIHQFEPLFAPAPAPLQVPTAPLVLSHPQPSGTSRRVYDPARERQWASQVYQEAKRFVVGLLSRTNMPMPYRDIAQAFQKAYPALCDPNIGDRKYPNRPYWDHLLADAMSVLKKSGAIRLQADKKWTTV